MRSVCAKFRFIFLLQANNIANKHLFLVSLLTQALNYLRMLHVEGFCFAPMREGVTSVED